MISLLDALSNFALHSLEPHFWEDSLNLLLSPKEKSPLMSKTVCNEAENLITLVIILAWIATDSPDGNKITYLFVKYKLLYVDE